MYLSETKLIPVNCPISAFKKEPWRYVHTPIQNSNIEITALILPLISDRNKTPKAKQHKDTAMQYSNNVIQENQNSPGFVI